MSSIKSVRALVGELQSKANGQNIAVEEQCSGGRMTEKKNSSRVSDVLRRLRMMPNVSWNQTQAIMITWACKKCIT